MCLFASQLIWCAYVLSSQLCVRKNCFLLLISRLLLFKHRMCTRTHIGTNTHQSLRSNRPLVPYVRQNGRKMSVFSISYAKLTVFFSFGSDFRTNNRNTYIHTCAQPRRQILFDDEYPHSYTRVYIEKVRGHSKYFQVTTKSHTLKRTHDRIFF